MSATARLLGLGVIIASMLLAVTAALNPQALAEGTCEGRAAPCIAWDEGMVVDTSLDGGPSGPVGLHALIHGHQFTPGQQLALSIVPGLYPNLSAARSFCQSASPKAAIGTVTVDPAGAFDQRFDWPSAASKVNQRYSVCAYLGAHNTAVGNTTTNVFTLLASSAPSLAVSPASVAAGDAVTVTGKNWVPARTVHVEVRTCAACADAPLAALDATAAGSEGTFTATVMIAGTAKAGQYVVTAATTDGVLDAGRDGASPLAVQPAATPTTGAVAPTTSGPGGAPNGVVLLALLGIGCILLAAFALTLARRRATRLTGAGIKEQAAVGARRGAPPRRLP